LPLGHRIEEWLYGGTATVTIGTELEIFGDDGRSPHRRRGTVNRFRVRVSVSVRSILALSDLSRRVGGPKRTLSKEPRYSRIARGLLQGNDPGVSIQPGGRCESALSRRRCCAALGPLVCVQHLPNVVPANGAEQAG
jgi:hypothetical protein